MITRQHAARLMFGAGMLALMASLFLPYWQVRVRAPQYPQGLVLVVYPHRLGGDVREIDMLNHYIGMRALERGAQTERKLAIPGVILAGLCLLGAALWLNRWSVMLTLPALGLPWIFVADLYWWMRSFGLHLDPRAPLSHAIKPFVPPILGEGTIAQFHASAQFTAGFYLTLAAAALAATGWYLRWRKPQTVAPHGAAALAVGLCCWVWLTPPAQAATLLVGPRESYTTIDAALTSAAAGDTIVVRGGHYAAPLVVRQTVTLIGEHAPVIDGGGRGTVVQLAAPGITLRGFTIRGSGDLLASEHAGILVTAANARVESNTLEDVLFGITLARAPQTIVRGNRLRGKPLAMGRRGDLIRVWYSDGVTLEDNHALDGRDIVLWFSKQLTVHGNDIRGGRYGLHFMYCDDAMVEANVLTNNSVGVYLMYSARLRLRHNRIVGNRGPSGYGIGFKDMQATRIQENLIADNRVGLFLDNADSVITDNLIAYNDAGIALQPSSLHNELSGNNLVENGDQVTISGLADQAARNHWHGNYWSDYRGYDADGDGRGEMPYQSVQLFERLADRYPSLRLFGGSPAVRTLEFAARLFPIFAPRSQLTDEAPRMRPVPSLWMRQAP